MYALVQKSCNISEITNYFTMKPLWNITRILFFMFIVLMIYINSSVLHLKHPLFDSKSGISQHSTVDYLHLYAV